MNIERVLDHIDKLFDDNGYALDSTQTIIISTAIQDELDYQEEER